MSSNFLSLNASKTEFLHISLPRQLAQFQNPTISPRKCYSALLPRLKFLVQSLILTSPFLTSPFLFSVVSKSCFQDIRDLGRIRSSIDLTTARISAAPLIHTKLDCCNSFLLSCPFSHSNRLQLVLNVAARAVANIHVRLKSLHMLKV